MNRDRGISVSVSIILHALAFLLMFTLYFGGSIPTESKSTIEFEFEEVPQIGGDPGVKGDPGEKTNEVTATAETKEEKKVKDKVKPPEAKNTDKDGVKTPPKDDKGKQGNQNQGGNPNPGTGGGTTYGTGYSIGWGGKGKRAVLSWNVPKYPAGVNIEGNVVLSFTILPNGTVGSVVPVKKLDPKLDNLSINALKTWRFEKLPAGENFVQNVTITFPFRLR